MIQNNHFRGQALVNALQMKRLLQGSAHRRRRNWSLAYPELEAEVRSQAEPVVLDAGHPDDPLRWRRQRSGRGSDARAVERAAGSDRRLARLLGVLARRDSR